MRRRGSAHTESLMLPSSSTDDPTPPAGYQHAYVVRYPMLVLNLVSVVVFIILVPLLGVLAWRLHKAPLAFPVEVRLTLLDIPGGLVASIMTGVFHELIHGIVLRYYGYRASYGMAWRLFAAYAAAFGQFQRRDHAILNTLAPLVIISLIMFPLLAMPNHYAIIVAYSALLTNIPGAVGDLYMAWRLLRLPRQTLLYEVDPRQLLIFQPA